MAEIYIHNSTHKDFIRDKWIEFANEIYDGIDEFGIITFPAEEMQDLKLFAEQGLLEWEYLEETGAYDIKKGKIICFEKSTKIYKALQEKLVNAKVEPKEIGSFLSENYHKFSQGSNTHFFPVHVVNLDYDGNISKNKISINEVIRLTIFYQKIHKRSFSLFITWPCSENEDGEDYKTLLSDTIQGNIDALEGFRRRFSELYTSLDTIEYDNLSVVGISKIVIHHAAQNLFSLNKNEFYVYGEEGRRKMYSLLFNLEYSGQQGREQLIYQNNVIRALDLHTTL
ncbi:MAG TPA: hypothetical protein VF622_03230 [Segetibacter sp.]|jgi:hypothetical protein